MTIKINNTDFIFHINVGNLDNKQHWTIDWCHDQCLTDSWTFTQIYSKGFGDCI